MTALILRQEGRSAVTIRVMAFCHRAGIGCASNPLCWDGELVSRELIRVLWLCDPRGVGETMVGWEVFSQLTRAGIGAGYVNVDQPGMC
jgi:hypothetical protein